MLGRERYTAGPYFRKKAKELGIPLEDTLKFPKKFHRDVDQIMYSHMISGEPIVIEGWFQGVNAWMHNVVSDRVYVECPDEVRFSRIAPRDGVTPQEAQIINLERESQNTQMFRQIYRINDFTDPKYYTLRVSSEKMGRQELALYTLGQLGIVDQIVSG